MHRYFARRPYSVFAGLIDHYSQPGDLILDPFCGGGVTIFEAMSSGRRAVGMDTNPLATFIARMQVRQIDIDKFEAAVSDVLNNFQARTSTVFSTRCRKCGNKCAEVQWFEYSYLTACENCSSSFAIAEAKKLGIGQWCCPSCKAAFKFSPTSSDSYRLVALRYTCHGCGNTETTDPKKPDITSHKEIAVTLEEAVQRGLWLPDSCIPECNMERESALHKKGFKKFTDLFTDRYLLALGMLKECIKAYGGAQQEWLLFAFSATLRYANRMVTRNPAWRKDRPLEWAKPGFWLPPTFLETNVAEEFRRRCSAIVKGKTDRDPDLFAGIVTEANAPSALLEKKIRTGYFLGTGSSAQLQLPDCSVDVIITDPPYGSYVHYADLSNFWAVWLPEIPGMGKLIATDQEAVVARKSFPGAKSVLDYRRLLEGCFRECYRVLKDPAYMVLTFNNREPRAWAAMITAALRAGFILAEGGVKFQDGISSYKHTAQSRREGSVIGDFVFSFRKDATGLTKRLKAARSNKAGAETALIISDEEYMVLIEAILSRNGPLTPNELLTMLHVEQIPIIVRNIERALNEGTDPDELVSQFDSVELLDSHRKERLSCRFDFIHGKWHTRKAA